MLLTGFRSELSEIGQGPSPSVFRLATMVFGSGKKTPKKAKKVVDAEGKNKEENIEAGRRESVDNLLSKKNDDSKKKKKKGKEQARRTSVDSYLGKKLRNELQKEGSDVPKSSEEMNEFELEIFEEARRSTSDTLFVQGGAGTRLPNVKPHVKSQTRKSAHSYFKPQQFHSVGKDGEAPVLYSQERDLRSDLRDKLKGKSKKAGEEKEEEEFDYAFEGKPREAKTHKRKFKTKKAPQNIFMDRKEVAAGIVEEEEETGSSGEGSPETTGAGKERRFEREKSIEMTADQWNAIIQIQYEDEANEKEEYLLSDALIYEEAISQLNPFMDGKAVSYDYEPSCWLSFKSFASTMFSKPEWYEKDYTYITDLAKKQFNNDNAIHESILASIYFAIYGDEANKVQRYGKHWEEIGFQGSNPATDLRDVGMWGLAQILFFVENCFNSAQMMFDYSHDANYGFPFCITAINISGMGLDLLKKGAFVGAAVDINSLHKALNMWYCGAMHIFFITWKESKCTMEDSGTHLHMVRTEMLNKSTIRQVMVEGSMLSECYVNGEEQVEQEEIEFSQI